MPPMSPLPPPSTTPNSNKSQSRPSSTTPNSSSHNNNSSRNTGLNTSKQESHNRSNTPNMNPHHHHSSLSHHQGSFSSSNVNSNFPKPQASPNQSQQLPAHLLPPSFSPFNNNNSFTNHVYSNNSPLQPQSIKASSVIPSTAPLPTNSNKNTNLNNLTNKNVTNRNGKWCAAHVKIAHLIMIHQQQKHLTMQQQQHQQQQKSSRSVTPTSNIPNNLIQPTFLPFSSNKKHNQSFNDLPIQPGLNNSINKINNNSITATSASTFFPPIQPIGNAAPSTPFGGLASMSHPYMNSPSSNKSHQFHAVEENHKNNNHQNNPNNKNTVNSHHGNTTNSSLSNHKSSNSNGVHSINNSSKKNHHSSHNQTNNHQSHQYNNDLSKSGSSNSKSLSNSQFSNNKQRSRSRSRSPIGQRNTHIVSPHLNSEKPNNPIMNPNLSATEAAITAMAQHHIMMKHFAPGLMPSGILPPSLMPSSHNGFPASHFPLNLPPPMSTLPYQNSAVSPQQQHMLSMPRPSSTSSISSTNSSVNPQMLSPKTKPLVPGPSGQPPLPSLPGSMPTSEADFLRIFSAITASSMNPMAHQALINAMPPLSTSPSLKSSQANKDLTQNAINNQLMMQLLENLHNPVKKDVISKDEKNMSERNKKENNKELERATLEQEDRNDEDDEINYKKAKKHKLSYSTEKLLNTNDIPSKKSLEEFPTTAETIPVVETKENFKDEQNEPNEIVEEPEAESIGLVNSEMSENKESNDKNISQPSLETMTESEIINPVEDIKPQSSKSNTYEEVTETNDKKEDISVEPIISNNDQIAKEQPEAACD